LGLHFGYEMVYCERCGVNCILVLNSALPLSCQRRAPPTGAAINATDLALYKNTAVLGGFSMPLVPYPCFGTARTGGSIPGHEYDPKERSAVVLQPDLLQKIATGQVAISDIESSMTSCKSNHSRPDSLLAGHIRSQIRERDPAKEADEEMTEYDIEIAFDARATWDQTGESYKLYLRASLCDDVEKRSLEFCARHDTVKGDCDLVRETLQREFDKREKDRAMKVCPNRS
jgi:hypothetical protein